MSHGKTIQRQFTQESDQLINTSEMVKIKPKRGAKAKNRKKSAEAEAEATRLLLMQS